MSHNFEACVREQKKHLQKKASPNSLYAQRLYEDQSARAKCTPQSVFEGFDGGNFTNNNMIMQLIKWAIIILTLWIIISLIMDSCKPSDTITLEIRPLTEGTVGTANL